jgi:AAA ATPase domain
MRIRRIRLRNYRGIAEHEVDVPARGVTVIEGDNEVGKSSLAEAVYLLFDTLDSSKSKAVLAVKPVHRDAGPEVEIDAEAGPYRFTYRKRFLKGAETVLVVHSPTPENRTGREAHARVLAILEETVDVPLWKALRLQQGVALEQADLSAQTSLGAALDAASAGALAGDREASLIDLAKAEFDRYYTTTRRLKADVVELEKAEAAAAERVEDLRRRLADLDHDVEHAAELVARMTDLGGEAAEQRQRVEEYKRQWQSVEALLQQVELAKAQSHLAQANVEKAEAEASRRQQLAEAVAAAERRHAELAAEHGRHQPALAAAAEALASAHKEREAAAEAVKLGEQLVRQRTEERDRQRDIHDLQMLAERWERVTDAEPRLAELEKLLDANRVDDEALAAIEDAHMAVVQARARNEGEQAVVELAALADVEVSVDGEPRALAAGEELTAPVAGAVAVDVGGLARVVVRAGREAGQSASALAETEARLASVCAQAGVDRLAQARQQAADRRAALSEGDRLNTQLQHDLRDLTPDRMAKKIERLRERVGDGPDTLVPVDFDAIRRMVDDATALAAAAQGAQREWDDEVKRLQAHVHEAERQAAASQTEVELAARQLASAKEALAEARRQVGDGDLAAALEDAGQRARDAARALDQAAGAADKARPDDLKQALDNAAAVLAKVEGEQRGAEHESIRIRQKLAVLGEEGLHDRLGEAEADLEQRRRQRRAGEKRAAAARRLYETLERCRGEARRAYVAPLRDKVANFGRIVFGEDFSVELDEDLRIVTRTLGGVTVEFEQLSTGAREQLCVISRLACAALVAPDGGVPVVLDDALGWSDTKRLEKLGAVLSLAAQDAQVLVLTCLPERYRHVGAAHVVKLGRSSAA